MRKVLGIIAILLIFLPAIASAAIINAASCSQANVQSAIGSASSGDTVNVPAGTCTWSSGVSVAKDIAIIGAGSLSTKITGSQFCFEIDLAHTIRISGFSFASCGILSVNPPVAGKAFRIDHNSFRIEGSMQENVFSGDVHTPMLHPTGLVDNNKFYNNRLLIAGTMAMLEAGNYQHQLWAQAPPVGKGTGIVYAEDNIITNDPAVFQNFVDGNYGGRYVLRFNNLTGDTHMAVHSVQGNNRAVQWWEFYKNIQNKPTTGWAPFVYLRGGSGVVWGNRVSSTYTNDILMNNVRSCYDPGEGVGKCTGSSNWDQNTVGMSGYACRDQIGRSGDNSLWSPGMAYAQPLTPAYFWDNIKGTNNQMIVYVDPSEDCPGTGGNLNPTHIVQNRDFYTQSTSFTGASGIGVGTLANRPSTCTVGVAYWATDQGEWNSNQPGADGLLYKCTATNTWSVYYKPYTYPHPLRTDCTNYPILCDAGSTPSPQCSLASDCADQSCKTKACISQQCVYTDVAPVCPAASTVNCGVAITSTNGCGSCSGTGTSCNTGACTNGQCITTPPVVAGDLNNDGRVDISDLVIVAVNFGRSSGFDSRANVVSSNPEVIDIADLVFVARRYTG